MTAAKQAALLAATAATPRDGGARCTCRSGRSAIAKYLSWKRSNGQAVDPDARFSSLFLAQRFARPIAVRARAAVIRWQGKGAESNRGKPTNAMRRSLAGFDEAGWEDRDQERQSAKRRKQRTIQGDARHHASDGKHREGELALVRGTGPVPGESAHDTDNRDPASDHHLRSSSWNWKRFRWRLKFTRPLHHEGDS